jgi:tRNA1Val (adenine37-N6)-methyltransferase
LLQAIYSSALQGAIKVNINGVLPEAGKDVSEARNIVDIGTGKGVIALTAAQSNKQAIMDVINIDRPAFEQATQNFKDSGWQDRLFPFRCAV